MKDLCAAGPAPGERELLGLALEVCPALEPAEVVYRSRTSLVVSGSLDGAAAVAKIRTPDWRGQCLREIEVYDVFEASPPPVPVPRRFGSDPERGVLVLERLAGEVVAPERFPAAGVTDADVAGVLGAVERLRHWRPAVPDGWRVEYRPMLEGIRARGVFAGEDWAAVLRLLDLSGRPREIGHGDPVPANVVRTGRGYALIDWASCALYLPCFDLAQLWLLLGDVPGARERVEAAVADRGAAEEGTVPFLLNLTMLLYRERRAHRRPADAAAEARGARLDAAWRQVLERVRHCAAGAG